MNILRRLSQLETKMKTASAKGIKYFYSYDYQTFYHMKEALSATQAPTQTTPIDYREICRGASGQPDPKDEIFTKSQLAELNVKGWTCFVYHWVDMNKEPKLEF